MNTSPQMSLPEIAATQLAVLQREHRDLDDAIAALATVSAPCSLTLQRMKKRKLALKDRIARLQDEITPDIIA